MKVLKKFEFANARGASKYPWEEWCDGQTRELEQGKDFSSMVMPFVHHLYSVARKKSMKVRISSTSNTVTFQFYKPE